MLKKEIWIIDDDGIYQIIAKKIIQRSELFSKISSFKNGQEAFDNLFAAIEKEASLPDIILLDINMPIMDGWEFMEETIKLESRYLKDIAVYIVSSSIAVEDKNKSKTYFNILGYLSKPLTLNDLELIAHSH